MNAREVCYCCYENLKSALINRPFRFIGQPLVQTHQDSHEEGTTKPIPPQETEMICHGTSDPQKGCITACYGNCSASDRKALQRVVRTAQYITGAKLPSIQDIYTRLCQRKAQKTVKDPSHPSHRLFFLLPHGKRYRGAKSRTKRLLNN